MKEVTVVYENKTIKRSIPTLEEILSTCPELSTIENLSVSHYIQDKDEVYEFEVSYKNGGIIVHRARRLSEALVEEYRQALSMEGLN